MSTASRQLREVLRSLSYGERNVVRMILLDRARIAKLEAALREIADLADVDADNRGNIVRAALAKPQEDG